MNIQKIDINKLKPATYNPRKNLQKDDAEYKKIYNSIQKFGYVEPIIINGDKTIIGGHQRYKVLKDLGYANIDCVVLDLDKNSEKMLNIALNKISGDWDMSLLKDLLLDLDSVNFDIELTGFDMTEVENLMCQFHVEEDTRNETIEEEKKKFDIKISCKDEKEYNTLYERLLREGFSVK